MAAILRVRDDNGNVFDIPAIKGEKGEKGDKGDQGLPGAAGLPSGGTAGQALVKNSNVDADVKWAYIEPGTDSAVTYTEQTLTEAQKTQARKNIGAGTSNFSGSYNDLTNKPTIPKALSELTEDTTHKTVSDAEKAVWNAKSDFSGSYNDLTNKPTIPSAYTLPTASSTTLGGVKIGSGISVSSDGTISASGGSSGGGSSSEKNYRKIATVTISEEIASIEITEDLEGQPFEITDVLISGSGVKASASCQIYLAFSKATTLQGWTGLNDFVNPSTAKKIYMESLWRGRRTLYLSSSQYPNGTLSTIISPNNDSTGNVEKISYIKIYPSTGTFTAGTINVYGG